jgi:oxygen-independent coproporphyrinogen-3 oxidase
MARALAPLDLGRRVTAETEWTMEANPSSVSVESLREYRALGVNRVSMGVQALRDDLLARLGRVHSRDAALRALDAIFAAGFTNVSVDLLCGVPNQDVADVDDAMRTLAQYPITHLSCYLLTLPPHHRMFRELPDEEGQLAHLLAVDRFMRDLGFEHYEISNFARPGMRARHNLAYWKGQSYLGLGPSAHSFDADASRRWKNVSSLHRYAALLAGGQGVDEWSETLTPEQRGLERWMLALRLDEGFPTAWLARDDQRAKARAFREQGWMEPHPEDPSRMRLTATGFAISEQIISALA